MLSEQKFFPSKLPIVQAYMHGCSNLELALAVNEAGGFPSLGVDQTDTFDNYLDQLDHVFTEFRLCTGHANFLTLISNVHLDNARLIKLLYKFKVSHIDLIGSDGIGQQTLLSEYSKIINHPLKLAGLKHLKSFSKILVRIFSVNDVALYTNQYIDGFLIKGSDSAGKTGSISVQACFDQLKKQYPDYALIPMGGISTSEQVQYYINNGAAAVAIGSALAVSNESCLSQLAKEKIIASSKKNITQFADTKQNALVIDLEPSADSNRSDSLYQGIQKGTTGHLYVGHGIDNIHSVRSAQDIIQDLAKDLKPNHTR